MSLAFKETICCVSLSSSSTLQIFWDLCHLWQVLGSLNYVLSHLLPAYPWQQTLKRSLKMDVGDNQWLAVLLFSFARATLPSLCFCCSTVQSVLKTVTGQTNNRQAQHPDLPVTYYHWFLWWVHFFSGPIQHSEQRSLKPEYAEPACSMPRRTPPLVADIINSDV